MRETTKILIVLFAAHAAAVFIGCGGSGSGGGSDEDNQAENETLQESEAADEAEAEENDGMLAVPYMPPKWPNPYIDKPYLQEYNSNPTQVETEIGALVAVILPPAGFDGFDVPTQINKRGVIVHKKEGGFDTIAIDETHPDLIAGAAANEAIVMANETRVYLVYGDKQIKVVEAPNGAKITGISAQKKNIYVFTDKGAGALATDGAVKWDIADGKIATAAVEFSLAVGRANSELLALGGDGFLNLYEALAGDKLGAPLASLDADGTYKAGAAVALLSGVELPVKADLLAVGKTGLQAFNVQFSAGVFSLVEVPSDMFAATSVPLDGPNAAVKAWDGGFIVGTNGGAYRIMNRDMGLEWRVYNAERWVVNEFVTGIATDETKSASPIYFATKGGLSTVTTKLETLEQKLKLFVDRIKLRHDRDGAVADSRLLKRGDLSTNVPWDSDNDGSWTSYWLLGECFRYTVTKADDAKANVDKSLEAMLRLHDLTGTDYFLARAVIKKEGCNLDDCDDPDDGHWYSSPDGKWWVKRDTSNDEVIAHAFMMGHLYDLCADDAMKERIKKHIANIFSGIIKNGWQLIDPITNKVTTYGQFDPYYVNEEIEGKYGDGGLRSAEILAGLTLAYYLTKDQKFLDAKWTLINEYGYADNAERESLYVGNQQSGDHDEMSTESWFVLLRYEHDPALRERWVKGWGLDYKKISVQQGAWWDLVNAMSGGENARIDYAVRWLKLAPVDMIRWNQHNSHRKDLIACHKPYDQNGRIRSDGKIIPYDERRCDRWNTNQYMVDGGMGGVIEMDGADVLAPYWMARYYGFIKADGE